MLCAGQGCAPFLFRNLAGEVKPLIPVIFCGIMPLTIKLIGGGVVVSIHMQAFLVCRIGINVHQAAFLWQTCIKIGIKPSFNFHFFCDVISTTGLAWGDFSRVTEKDQTIVAHVQALEG